jgi:DNA helicase-2/ATP-dependent DNA helicase PcrA
MEEALRKRDIPYKIYGGTSFYQRKEIKDILAYARLVVNPNDDEALKRIINYPARGIGKTTEDKISFKANDTDRSMWQVISDAPLNELEIHAGSRTKVKGFVDMLRYFQQLQKQKNAYELMEEIAKTTGLLKELFTDKTPEGIARYDNIQELLNGVKEFVESHADEETGEMGDRSLAVFLQDIALLTDADDKDKNDSNKVSLMTIHAAKGLEFPYVFIVGLEENLFPSQLSLNSRAELEEERRLFYVALTRAEKEVQLSYAASRYRWGNLIYCEPSRFIEDIDEEFLDFAAPETEPQAFTQARSNYFGIQNKQSYQNKDRMGKVVSKPKRSTEKEKVIPPHKKMVSVSDAKRKVDPSFAANAEKIAEGMRVEHLRFGKGRVEKLEGAEPNRKATIKFDQVGEKQLLLKFAKLRILK